MQCVLKVSQNKRDLWLLLCWPVYTYADYYKGWKIQAECPEESHYATHRVSCFPGYRARPSDFEWHHQECHLDNDKMQHISCLLQANRERYDYFIASYLRSRRYILTKRSAIDKCITRFCIRDLDFRFFIMVSTEIFPMADITIRML